MDRIIVYGVVGAIALLLLLLLFCVAIIMLKVIIQGVDIEEDYEI